MEFWYTPNQSNLICISKKKNEIGQLLRYISRLQSWTCFCTNQGTKQYYLMLFICFSLLKLKTFFKFYNFFQIWLNIYYACDLSQSELFSTHLCGIFLVILKYYKKVLKHFEFDILLLLMQMNLCLFRSIFITLSEIKAQNCDMKKKCNN